MTPEFYAIIGAAIALGGLILNGQRANRLAVMELRREVGDLRQEVGRLCQEVGDLRERVAHMEELIEGLREAIVNKAA